MHWTSCGNQQVVEVILVAIHGITPREVIMLSGYIWQVTLTSRDGGTASSTEVEAQTDSGATFNIIPRHILDRLHGVLETRVNCAHFREVDTDELRPCDSAIWQEVEGIVIRFASKVTLHVRLHGGNLEGNTVTFRVASPRWLAPHIYITRDALSSLQ